MENKKIDDGEKMLSLLTNSEAYQLYLKTNKRMIEKCINYANKMISDIKNDMNSKCVDRGHTNYVQHFAFKEKYIKDCNTGYITANELDFIIKHFKDNGYNIKVEFEHSIFNFFKRKKERIGVRIFIDWDFSNI